MGIQGPVDAALDPWTTQTSDNRQNLGSFGPHLHALHTGSHANVWAGSAESPLLLLIMALAAVRGTSRATIC